MTIDVATWLKSLGLEDYASAFEEGGVDAALLLELTNEDLKDLGVARLADRKRLLKAIADLSESEKGTKTQSSTAPSAPSERRQVTVLFADLTGYTRLSDELDSEDLHALLGAFFETI